MTRRLAFLPLMPAFATCRKRLRGNVARSRLAWLPLISVLAAGALLPATSPAELLVDRGRLIEGLWVFPQKDRPRVYRYLPQRAHLSTNADGEPQFSLTFFVDEKPAIVDGETVDGETADGETATRSIGTASGGAILHLLVEYGTAPETVEAAQSALRRVLDDDEVVIDGPVVFDSGTFSVVSSVLTGDGSRSATMIAQRPAPVLEGQSVALSFELEPRLANVLLATMQTDTPDFSVAFDLRFHGLSDAYDAEMLIDWEKTENSLQAGGGIDIYVVSLDAEAAIEKAFQDGAIELVAHGEDAAMESLVELAYSKAMDILYAPIEIDQIPAAERGGMMDALGTMIGGLGGSDASSSLGFGLSASYRMKDLRSEGVTRLSFRKASTVTRNAMLTVNLGDFYARYGEDERYFRVESTGDCDFAQRRVFVLVDGALRPDIGSFVNHVGVWLRKRHASSAMTLRELVIDPRNLADSPTLGPLTYNSKGDACDERWLAYQYRTDWNFVGGGTWTSDWQNSSSASIGLTAPYHRELVNITGDMQALAERGVRAVIVEVGSDFFGEDRVQRRTIRPSSDAPSIEPVSLVLPAGVYDYRYEVTWILSGNERIKAEGTDDLGFIFLDEIPEGS